MAQITNFFAGANSGEGFRNLFSEMVDIENTYDFMVLKGGPGVGKNTFMREIGRTMEAAGTPVEYLWCSGDPDSLDGVVLPELRCAVADGTSPHGSVSKGRFCRGWNPRRHMPSFLEPAPSHHHINSHDVDPVPIQRHNHSFRIDALQVFYGELII